MKTIEEVLQSVDTHEVDTPTFGGVEPEDTIAVSIPLLIFLETNEPSKEQK